MSYLTFTASIGIGRSNANANTVDIYIKNNNIDSCNIAIRVRF